MTDLLVPIITSALLFNYCIRPTNWSTGTSEMQPIIYTHLVYCISVQLFAKWFDKDKLLTDLIRPMNSYPIKSDILIYGVTVFVFVCVSVFVIISTFISNTCITWKQSKYNKNMIQPMPNLMSWSGLLASIFSLMCTYHSKICKSRLQLHFKTRSIHFNNMNFSVLGYFISSLLFMPYFISMSHSVRFPKPSEWVRL